MPYTTEKAGRSLVHRPPRTPHTLRPRPPMFAQVAAPRVRDSSE
eukprot:SAG22_NODE_3144_length_1906_cov_1.021029_3_plen_43_part_01